MILEVTAVGSSQYRLPRGGGLSQRGKAGTREWESSQRLPKTGALGLSGA